MIDPEAVMASEQIALNQELFSTTRHDENEQKALDLPGYWCQLGGKVLSIDG